MNKKGDLDKQTLGIMIITLVTIFFASILIYQIYIKTSNTSNIAIIQTWVNEKSTLNSIPLAGSRIPVPDRPPIPELAEPYLVYEKDLEWNDNDPPKLFYEIADSMVDCYTAFNHGKSDFVDNIQRDVFCYPCRQFAFEDKIKNDKVVIKDFEKFLYDTKPGIIKDKTYAELIDYKKVPTIQIENKDLVIDNNLYIYYVGFSGRKFTQILGEAGGFKTDTQINAGDIGENSAEVAAGTGSSALKSGIQAAEDSSAWKNVLTNLGSDAAKAGKSEALLLNLGKVLGTKGLKFVPIVGWGFQGVDTGTGILRIIWGDKPFPSAVTIADAEQVNSLCNEKVEDIRVPSEPIDVADNSQRLEDSSPGGIAS
ncbi:MAG: hypothetical protein AABX19_02330 [Nanoarchaeota archaeon]